MTLSPEMYDRVIAMQRRRLDAGKAERERAGAVPAFGMRDPIGALLMSFICAATDDARAENLIRLLEDWEQYGETRSAIGQVIAGRIDLVALLKVGE